MSHSSGLSDPGPILRRRRLLKSANCAERNDDDESLLLELEEGEEISGGDPSVR